MEESDILIRIPNWIGDAVVSTAILKPIREYFRKGRITVVVKKYVHPIFHNNPFIDEIIVLKGIRETARRIRGDIGIILPNSFSSALLFALGRVKERIGYRSECRGFLLTKPLSPPQLRKEHLLENYTRLAMEVLAGNDEYDFIPRIFLQEEEKSEFLQKELAPTEIKDSVVVDPGSAYGAAKIWQLEKYAQVIDYIKNEKKLEVLLLGPKTGEEIAREIVKKTSNKPRLLTGKLTLRESMYVISQCRMFISPDTGGMHIAASFGVPQIAIFGSSSPVWTRPLNERSRVIYKNLPCSPCFQRTCRLNTYECLVSISVHEVVEAMEKMI
jgi:heptosyltransferase-2